MTDGTIVYDYFDPQACTNGSTKTLTYNQAWFIEGISVMADVTKDQSLMNLYVFPYRPPRPMVLTVHHLVKAHDCSPEHDYFPRVDLAKRRHQ